MQADNTVLTSSFGYGGQNNRRVLALSSSRATSKRRGLRATDYRRLLRQAVSDNIKFISRKTDRKRQACYEQCARNIFPNLLMFGSFSSSVETMYCILLDCVLVFPLNSYAVSEVSTLSLDRLF